MISAFADPDMPPLMSPESQQASPFRVGLANLNQGMNNFSENMKNPAKQAVLTAMMVNSMGKFGQGLGGSQQLQPRQERRHDFDMFGNPLG